MEKLAQRLEIVNPTAGAAPIVIEGPLKSELADAGIGGIINVILSFLYPLAAVILFFVLVWGGYDIMTSAGNSDKVASGGKKITSGLIGFILLILSFFITRLIAYVFGLDNGLF